MQRSSSVGSVMRGSYPMNYDELHDIIKRIDKLLTDRQPGKVSWLILLRANLRELMQFVVNVAFVE